MHNKTTWNEKLFVGKLNDWYQRYFTKEGVQHYATHSPLYITTMREKHITMYKKAYQSTVDVCQYNKSSLKGLYANFSIAPKRNCRKF